jgi:hypothetical protein
MSFKHKNKIKKKCDTRTTLDAKHNNYINELSEEQNSLKNKETQLTNLKIQYNNFDNNNHNLNSEQLENKLKVQFEIKSLVKDIENIKNKNNDINYLLDTGKILFQYYDSLNNEAEGVTVNSNNNNSNSIMDYFNTSKNKNITNTNNDSRATLYNKFLNKVDNKININSDINLDLCSKCNIEKKIFLSDAKKICINCGEESPILIDSDKPSYKDPPREICYFAYKRINHFNEWLAQFQAKESTDIPQDIYNEIILELKKERILDMKHLSQKKLREILKKLKKNKYYEHIPHIINKLNGIPPPIMTRNTEEELRRMFKEIQIPFLKHCPHDRKNFLSYSYVLHKFVELLELDEFLACFVLLKSREKLHQQDQIWKKICEELNWQFIQSI